MRRTRVTVTFDQLAQALGQVSDFARDNELVGSDVMAVQVDHGTRTLTAHVSLGRPVPDGAEARDAGAWSSTDPTRPTGARVTS